MNSNASQKPQQQKQAAQDPKKSAPHPQPNPKEYLSYPPSQSSKHPSLVPHPHPPPHTPPRGSGVPPTQPHTPKAPTMTIFPPTPTLRERYESTKTKTPDKTKATPPRPTPMPTHRLPMSGPRLTTNVNVPDEDYEQFYKSRRGRS